MRGETGGNFSEMGATWVIGCFNTPLEHTPGNPLFDNYERNPSLAFRRGLGVCSKGVLKQPLIG